MADPSFSLQVALADCLKAGLDCEVYDSAPNNVPFPYVVFDSEIADEDDFLNSRMDQRFLYLSVWSQDHGQQQVKEIMGQIDTLLHNQRLPLATGRIVSMRITRKQSIPDADCKTFQGAVTLSIKTQH